MPFENRIIIASAGSGKTTEIVEDVLTTDERRYLITTFTLNNVAEIQKKFYEINGVVPKNVTILPWFTFLLREFARPYQNHFYEQHRVDSVTLVNGRSDRYAPKTNAKRYFFGKGNNIYSDKLSEFCCSCDSSSGGKVIARIQQSYSHIYIDEIQDLAGYDLAVLELLLSAKINLTMVGDHRQATLTTNQSPKNKKYRGAKIIDKFGEWEAKSLCKLEFKTESYRCSQPICDFADCFFPEFPSATSQNLAKTDHDGVFTIKSAQVQQYVDKYQPQILRYNRTELCQGFSALNFGDSKGLTFERVLIFPHGPLKKLMSTSEFENVKESAKMYVAFTRAKQSVVVVYDGEIGVKNVEQFVS